MIRNGFTRRGFGKAGLAASLLAGACGRAEAPEGVLRVGLAGAPDSLDPFVAEFAAAAVMLNQVHAPLESYRPGQGLIERWEPQADATRWVAHLRPGMQWSDGAPITAEDVVWSVRHGCEPSSTNPSIGDLLPIRGALDAFGEKIPLEEIGVAAPDAATVVFELNEKLGVFPETMREFYPIAPHAFERHGSAWTRPENFVGSGPYLPRSLTQLNIGLVRNPRYFGAEDVAISDIDVAAIDDAATRLRLFRAGDLDIAQDPPWAALADMHADVAAALRTFDSPRFAYLKVNHDRPLLADARVRRAMSMAIDRDFIAQELFHGFATPSETVIPGSPNGFDGTLEARRRTARALIAEAGAEGAQIELMHFGGDREGMAVALADDWAAIGLDIGILRTESTGLYAAVDEGRFDLALATFNRGLKDAPWRYLEPFVPGGFAANFNWDSPELAAALIRIRAEPDAGRRRALAYEAERLITDPQALIAIQHETASWMVAPRVRDAGPSQPLFWADLSLA